MRVTIIEHTADIGIEVEADDLGELFSAAAGGMAALVVDPAGVKVTMHREVTLEANDSEELMFKWLNELLFMIDAEGVALSRFEVEDVTGTRLRAVVRGEPLDLDRHEVGEEIKAATYHGLVVERRGAGWFARVIFDV